MIRENLYLIYMFAKRDLQTTFNQTILGVLWFLIVPVVTTLVFTLIFRGFANISTDGIPGILFYFSGIMLWNFFTNSVTTISNVFHGYYGIMSKVYFPRIIPPISILLSNLFKFGIQFSLFFVAVIYFQYKGEIQFTWWVLLSPLVILLASMASLGVGLIFCAISIKYKDFQPILTLLMTVFMYITPVIYPLSFLPEAYRGYASFNPMSSVIESFRFIWLNPQGEMSMNVLFIGVVVIFILLSLGLWLYNKVEKDFVDTI